MNQRETSRSTSESLLGPFKPADESREPQDRSSWKTMQTPRPDFEKPKQWRTSRTLYTITVHVQPTKEYPELPQWPEGTIKLLYSSRHTTWNLFKDQVQKHNINHGGTRCVTKKKPRRVKSNLTRTSVLRLHRHFDLFHSVLYLCHRSGLGPRRKQPWRSRSASAQVFVVRQTACGWNQICHLHEPTHTQVVSPSLKSDYTLQMDKHNDRQSAYSSPVLNHEDVITVYIQYIFIYIYI